MASILVLLNRVPLSNHYQGYRHLRRAPHFSEHNLSSACLLIVLLSVKHSGLPMLLVTVHLLSSPQASFIVDLFVLTQGLPFVAYLVPLAVASHGLPHH
jgi:hypothetical protein